MQTSTNLALNAKNTAVAEFDHLVNNKTVQSTVSKVEDVSGEVVASTKQISSLSISDLSKASAYVNSIPSKSNISNEVNNATNLVSDRLSDVSQSLQQATLSTDLYDKALSLPEANAVSLLKDYSIDYSPYASYGKFEGTAVYKDFSGTIDDSVKDVKNISGWVNINKQHEQYATITNNSVSYIVGVNDIKPEPTVSDFQPLYDILNSNNVCSIDSSVVDDIKIGQSQACTFKEWTSSIINNNSSDTEKYHSGATTVAGATTQAITAGYTSGGLGFTKQPQTQAGSGNSTSINNKVNSIVAEPRDYTGTDYNYLSIDYDLPYLGLLYPKQIGRIVTPVNRSVYNNVQAVIYDLAESITKDTTVDKLLMSDKIASRLLCYQQPENISYSAACQFDAPSPRGSQQPFQFYVAANAQNLNFTLKWHIDELRTLYLGDRDYEAISMQDIAQLAESFTRPWERGNSIEPKLCKVILPGVQHIGYISEANITYLGDMAGGYSSFGGGVMNTAGDNNTVYRSTTDYFYSQIEIAFSMIIIKDISLKKKVTSKENNENVMSITDAFSYAPTKEAKQQANDSDLKEDSDKKSNSGDIQKSTSSATEGVVNSDAATPTGETNSKAISAYKNEDGSPMFVGDGKAYKADKDSTDKGIVKSKDGSEMFITSGVMYSVVPEGSYGNKQYIDSHGYKQLASYSQEDVLYEDDSGGYCYYEEENNESTSVPVSYVTPYIEVIVSDGIACYWSGA